MAVQFKAELKQILFHDQDTGRSILRLSQVEDIDSRSPSPAGLDSVVVTGTYFSPEIGQSLVCQGELYNHTRYGQQLKAQAIYPAKLLGGEHLRAALQSGIFRPAVSDSVAAMIKFIERVSVEAILSSSEKVRHLCALQDKDYKQFTRDMQRYMFLREEFSFLKNLGVGDRLAGQICQVFGLRTREVITARPYAITSLPGVGFAKADEVAGKVGIVDSARLRTDAALAHLFSVALERGSTAINRTKLVEDLSKALRIEGATDELNTMLNRRLGSGLFYSFYRTAGDEVIVDLDSYNKELDIAQHLHRLAAAPTTPVAAGRIDSYYNEGQREAITAACKKKVLVVTGGPGVGKSTTMREVVGQLQSGLPPRSKILLGAPMGKAARRLAETTGLPADTMHGLIGLTPGANAAKQGEMLDCDALVLDEMSTANLDVFARTLSLLPDHARLILIGDSDQLPAVGAGNILADVIRSSKIPVARLTEVCRTAKGSRIAEVAHDINSGRLPDLDAPGNGFTWIDAHSDAEIVDRIRDVVTNKLCGEHGLSMDDIQILSPQIQTLAGIRNLNRELATIMNPVRQNDMPAVLFGNAFRVGDRVMQVDANVKQMDLYNGDVGKILYIDFKGRSATIEFDSGRKKIPFSKFINLRSAWASTVHKFQGSEAPAVVMPISNSHGSMLYRQLIYTAITRGKQQVVLVGDRSALERGIHNTEQMGRVTLLADHVSRVFSPPGRRRSMTP